MVVSRSPLALAEHLLALTQRQVEAASAGDWDHLSDLIDQRAPLADAIAALPFTALDSTTRTAIQSRCAAALDLDRQIADLARAARADLVNELRQIGHARHTLNAYRTPANAGTARLIDQNR